MKGTFYWLSDEFRNEAFEVQMLKGGEIPALKEMKTLILPESLTKIESDAFVGISAEAVFIPNGCSAIEAGAFMNCEKLIYVSVPAEIIIHDDAFLDSPCVIIDHR